MTITVAAELLWSTAVTASPVRTPSSGVAVSRASSRFMASPAARCKARAHPVHPVEEHRQPAEQRKEHLHPLLHLHPLSVSVWGAVPKMQKEDIPKVEMSSETRYLIKFQNSIRHNVQNQAFIKVINFG